MTSAFIGIVAIVVFLIFTAGYIVGFNVAKRAFKE